MTDLVIELRSTEYFDTTMCQKVVLKCKKQLMLEKNKENFIKAKFTIFLILSKYQSFSFVTSIKTLFLLMLRNSKIEI